MRSRGEIVSVFLFLQWHNVPNVVVFADIPMSIPYRFEG